MSNETKSAKLAELSAKTDRQLFDIVSNALEDGLMLARSAENQWDSFHFEQLRARARRAWDEARTLLPLLRGITQDRVELLEAKLEELGTMLECREEPMVCC